MNAETTPLDTAYFTMMRDEADDAARMRYYAALADTEIFVMLAREAEGATIAPRVFDLDEGAFALAFDSEARLAECTDVAVPYAALPGRVLARELAAQGLGLGINLGIAAPAMLLPVSALGWLTGTLAVEPDMGLGRVRFYGSPDGLSDEVLAALDLAFARCVGAAARAYLVGATYDNGLTGHLAVIVGAQPGSESALAKAVAEALTFSGADTGVVDVTFLAPDDAAISKLKAFARVFDLRRPEPQPAETPPNRPPGMDPARPPKLR
jgi:hypothetical protein